MFGKVFILLGFVLILNSLVQCDDTIDPDAVKSTDKDPWEKWSKLPSSGSNHRNGNSNDDDDHEVDITEVIIFCS